MTAVTVAPFSTARQLVNYTSDPAKMRLQRRAARLLDTALDYERSARMLINHLYAERTPEAMVKAQQLEKEASKKLRASTEASRRFLAYVEAHPIESYNG